MNSTTMQAIVSTGYGSPEVLQLQEVEKPLPAENEVLIKIKATSVTAAQTMIRTGYPLFGRLFLGLFKPKMKISGTDFAGVIEAVGAKVSKFKLGDEVFGSTDIDGGCYAEYTTVAENGVIFHKPENVSFEEAAAIIEGASTTLPFLQKIADIQPGQKILINGASGSIGTAAVQLAKYFGAEVTGVCSTANLKWVKTLGADRVIDYRLEDFTQNGQSYDIIFDTVGKSSFAKSKNSLTPQGKYLSPVLSLSTLWDMIKTSRSKGKKAVFAATGLIEKEEKIQNFSFFKSLLESGKLTSVIDRCYKLAQMVEAHHYVETGHKKGNVVVLVG